MSARAPDGGRRVRRLRHHLPASPRTRAVGRFSDRLVDSGGTVILSEPAEFMGAEHLLAARAENPDDARKIFEMVRWFEDEAKRNGVDMRGNESDPRQHRGRTDDARGEVARRHRQGRHPADRGGHGLLRDPEPERTRGDEHALGRMRVDDRTGGGRRPDHHLLHRPRATPSAPPSRPPSRSPATPTPRAPWARTSTST